MKVYRINCGCGGTFEFDENEIINTRVLYDYTSRTDKSICCPYCGEELNLEAYHYEIVEDERKEDIEVELVKKIHECRETLAVTDVDMEVYNTFEEACRTVTGALIEIMKKRWEERQRKEKE